MTKVTVADFPGFEPERPPDPADKPAIKRADGIGDMARGPVVGWFDEMWGGAVGRIGAEQRQGHRAEVGPIGDPLATKPAACR